MVHLFQMTQFVGHHIVQQSHGQMDQMPIQANGAIRACAAPTVLGLTQGKRRGLHTQESRKVLKPLMGNGLHESDVDSIDPVFGTALMRREVGTALMRVLGLMGQEVPWSALPFCFTGL